MADAKLEDIFRRAKAALDHRELRVATELCDQMLERKRNDFNALMLRADVAGTLGDFDREVEFLTRATRQEPKNARLRVHLGRRYAMTGKQSQALTQYDRALKLAPEGDDADDALAGKAAIYESQDHYDRARRLLDPVAGRDAPPPVVAAVYLRLLVHDGELDRAIEVGRRVTAKTHPPTQGLRATWFALARALERDGAYEEAIAAANEAHSVLRAPYEPESTRRETDALIGAFTRERIASSPRPDAPSEIPVFLIGMPRGGSTLAERILHAHPQVHGAGEIGAFHLLVHELWSGLSPPEPYPAGIDRLDAAVMSAAGDRYVTGLRKLAPKATRITNKHLGNYQHLGLINMLLPGARIIHCRRDPLDTCLSCYMERLTPAQAPYVDDFDTLGFHYREYERLMTHWRDVLDVPFLDLAYEDVVSDQEAATQRLLEFCDLPWDDACMRFHEIKRRDGTLSFDQVRRPLYATSVGRADRFGACLDPLRKALAGGSDRPV